MIYVHTFLLQIERLQLIHFINILRYELKFEEFSEITLAKCQSMNIEEPRKKSMHTNFQGGSTIILTQQFILLRKTNLEFLFATMYAI